MKNNIVFLIIISFLLNGCFLSVPVENYINMTPKEVESYYAPAGESFWKENTTIEETKKEYGYCSDVVSEKTDSYRDLLSHDKFWARATNDLYDCMLAKGFIYMDKGINNNYKSWCKHGSSFHRLVKVCKKINKK